MHEMQELQTANKELQRKMNEFMADVSGFLIITKLTLIAVTLLIASFFCGNDDSTISVLVFIYFISVIKNIFAMPFVVCKISLKTTAYTCILLQCGFKKCCMLISLLYHCWAYCLEFLNNMISCGRD